MIRSWGITVLTGAAQPVFGDVLTAAFVPPTGNNFGVLTVASTTRYQVGDRIILGAGNAAPNVVMVQGIKDATHLNVVAEAGGTLKPWVNGTLIALAIACFKIEVNPVAGDGAAVWIGSDNTVTAAPAGSAFAQIPWSIEKSTGQNPINTDCAWMIGAGSVGVAAHVN